jgi:hypothetical protein
MKTTIIVEVSSDNADAWEQPEYMGIAIDAALAENLLRRIRTVKALREHDRQLYEMVFWDYIGPFWFRRREISQVEEAEDIPLTVFHSEWDGGPEGDRGEPYGVVAILDGDPECLDEDAVWMECVTLNVHADGVHWHGIWKHTSIRIESGELSTALLESFLTP